MENLDNYAIFVKDLVKTYDGKTNAVDHLTFNVKKGEIYGLLGKNGAGKSTSIKILTTLIPPTSGKAYVMNYDVKRYASTIRKIIGVVQQDEAFDFTTVEGNFKIYKMLWQIPREEAKSRMEMLMDLFNLTEIRKMRLFELSGGQKKRVQVARELMHDMDVLFLDEPTVGMDPIMRRKVLDYIKKRAEEGLTVLFTTQILEEADYLCHRIGIMDKGKIVAEGSAAFLKERFGEIRKIEIKFDKKQDPENLSEIERYISGIPDVRSSTVNEDGITLLSKYIGRVLSELIVKLNSMGIRVNSVVSDNPSLDDVFMEVVSS